MFELSAFPPRVEEPVERRFLANDETVVEVFAGGFDKSADDKEEQRRGKREGSFHEARPSA